MYKCINSFKTSSGKSYSYGDKIYSSEYYSLDYSDRRNFGDDSYIATTDYSSSSSSFTMPSIDTDSSSSSSSFDFGGGDFGGGGSGGDW